MREGSTSYYSVSRIPRSRTNRRYPGTYKCQEFLFQKGKILLFEQRSSLGLALVTFHRKDLGVVHLILEATNMIRVAFSALAIHGVQPVQF